MSKQTLVTGGFTCDVVKINGEELLKITMQGISETNYKSTKNYSKKKTHEVFIDLDYLPYFLRMQREAIAKWELKKLEYIDRIKGAFTKEVKLAEGN